jgi:dTMP kinase
VVGLTTIQSRVSHVQVFPIAVLGAGGAMLVAASMSSLGLTMLFIGAMGVCAGAVYVLGFTLLQENVEDELRGRIFATLYTLSRLCLLVSLTLAPLAASAIDGLTDRVPGVRITLWIGAVIILLAGLLAARTLQPSAEPKR